jgi:hypothetical protein
MSLTNNDINLAGNITAIGNLTISTNPNYVNNITVSGTAYDASVVIDDVGADHVAQLILNRSSTSVQPIIASALNNSDDPTANVDVVNGQTLFQIATLGFAGTDYKEFAGIVMMVDDNANVSETSSPGKIDFRVTPDGSTSTESALTIYNNTTAEFAGNVQVNINLSVTGNIFGNIISATGNVGGGNILTGGIVSATGNITGSYILGNGSQLTGLPAGYANANAVAYGQAGWAGNIIPAANATYSLGSPTAQWASVYIGNATLYLGTTTVSANNTSNTLLVNGVAVATTTSPGNLNTSGSISATGNVTAANFIGNGYALTSINVANVTGLSTSSITNGTSNVNVTSSGGNVTTGVGGTANVIVAATTGVYVTGVISASGNITSNSNIAAGNLSTSGNIVGGGVRSSSQSTAPTNPTVGDFWYNTLTNSQYRFTFDGTDYFWLDDFGATTAENGSFNAITSGTSNVSIYSANANVQVSVAGTSNIAVFSTSGAAFTGLTVTTSGTPATSSSAGVTGQIQWDLNYVYICVAPNTWKRANISTW